MIDLIKKLNDILPPSDKKKLVLLFILMLIAAGLEVAGIGMILAFVSIVADPGSLEEITWLYFVLRHAGIENSRDLLIYGSFILIGVFLLKNIYLIVFNYIQSRFTYNRFQYISTNIFSAYMNAPYVFHLNRNTAQLIRNATVETNILINHILRSLLVMAMETVMIVAVILFLMVVEPFITVIILFILGGSGWLFLRFLKGRNQYYGNKALAYRGRMIQEVHEGLGGFKDARVMNRHMWFVKRFRSSMGKFIEAELFKDVSKHSSKPVIETIAVSGMLLIAVVLVWQGRDVASTVPVLALFSVSALRLMPALSRLITDYNMLRYYGHAVNPIHEDLMQLGGYIQNQSRAEDAQKILFENTIAIDNVNFSYPQSNRSALKNTSFTIPKGAIVGLTGVSGSGKTTLVDLILGLLEPSQGRITVDGVDIRDNMKGWQMNIGYIPQFIYLSDDTIRNNIAFGLDEDHINEDQLWNAVKIAQFERVVQDLPEGLDTIIGERGVKLSGGQRQRIGIARALYHNPEVLIMDEATSSLDNKTERYITKSLDRLRGDRTIIVIAHRLTTLRNCDILYVIKNGEIISSGKYEELLEESEDFKIMFNSSK